jgi:hypothetical protein
MSLISAGGSSASSKPVIIEFTDNELEAQGINLKQMHIGLENLVGAGATNRLLRDMLGPILQHQAARLGMSGDIAAAAQRKLMETITGTGITPEQRSQLDRIEGEQISKIRRSTQDNLELLRNELAPQRGMRASDTPIVDRGQRIAEAGVAAESQVGADRAQAEMQLPFQNLQTGSFLAQLQDADFLKRLQSTGQTLGGGINLAGLTDIAAQSQALRPQVGQKSKSESGEAGISDIRLKTDVEKIGETASGLPLYTFRYKDGYGPPGTYEGVMAQDLLAVRPDAVLKMSNGYFGVNYSRIDTDLREVIYTGTLNAEMFPVSHSQRISLPSYFSIRYVAARDIYLVSLSDSQRSN